MTHLTEKLSDWKRSEDLALAISALFSVRSLSPTMSFSQVDSQAVFDKRAGELDLTPFLETMNKKVRSFNFPPLGWFK